MPCCSDLAVFQEESVLALKPPGSNTTKAAEKMRNEERDQPKRRKKCFNHFAG
jgi:hypothetical protein